MRSSSITALILAATDTTTGKTVGTIRGNLLRDGGTVRYEPRVGGGSVFELRLPAANVAEPEAEPARSESL